MAEGATGQIFFNVVGCQLSQVFASMKAMVADTDAGRATSATGSNRGAECSVGCTGDLSSTEGAYKNGSSMFEGGEHEGLGVVDFTLGQGGLEDVFCRVVRES